MSLIDTNYKLIISYHEEIITNNMNLIIEKYHLPNKKPFNTIAGGKFIDDCYEFKLYINMIETATISCKIRQSLNILDKKMYLFWISVNDKYRNKGIGTFLMKRCIQLAYDNDCIMIELDNFADNMDFYKKFGFIYTDKVQLSYDIDNNMIRTPRELDQTGMTLFLLDSIKGYAIRSLLKNNI